LSSDIDSTETLQAYLDNHATLTVLASKATLQADGVETVSFSISGQMAFDYKLMQENIVKLVGSVNDGTLVFSTDIAGTYTVELKIGNATGYAQVEAL